MTVRVSLLIHPFPVSTRYKAIFLPTITSWSVILQSTSAKFTCNVVFALEITKFFKSLRFSVCLYDVSHW